MTKRIILVEDDEPVRDIFKLVFKQSNYELIQLDNGEMIIKDEISAPDLFILDKQISGTDGLEVCRHIKNDEKLKHVPVIMLSANPDIVDLAKTAGADMAISKPFSLRKLREAVVTMLDD
jgi:DNA-binding response OmpR family regulator